ncbi:MAG: hypothetical protein ABFD54_16640 [Armatimonadota bacterium]|nr:carboxypeptidase-like regulatory domain-containing protein [bacterium]
MRRFFAHLSIVALAATVTLAGCGGGGGGSSSGGSNSGGNNPPPVDTTQRTITGTVVNDDTGSPGVAGVTVSMTGDTVSVIDITDASGKFELKMPAGSTEVPPYLEVDTSAAGSGYSKTYGISYRSQRYLASQVDIPVDVRNGVTNDIGTITVVHSEDSDTPPAPAYRVCNTVITGRIVRSDTSAGISGVSVTFGANPSRTVTTGKYGYFAIDLGYDVPVLPVLGGLQTFSIDTSTASSTTYPRTRSVWYGGTVSLQSAVPIPVQVQTDMDNTDLGTISIIMTSSSGGDSGGDDGGDDGGGDGVIPPPDWPF